MCIRDRNGALAQETLESQGLTVQINKIYPDESQSSMVDIGCVLDTEPDVYKRQLQELREAMKKFCLLFPGMRPIF